MPAKTTHANRPPTQEQMVERIMAAVVEHRLPPGTRLVEDRLAQVFGVNRARVRPVLARLAHEGIVTLHPNRGAAISEPTAEQAREVFELRRLLEPAIVQTLAARTDRAVERRLEAHLKREAEAAARDDHRALIRLTGEFHLLLAELAGNQLMLRMLRELETLTSLVIYLYESPNTPACRGDDHVEIAAAIARGDGARAARLMLAHLNEVEEGLDMAPPPEAAFDLAEALAG
ncbi:MAG: GntR family transcriptional regulator [Burkholderiales bacterium]|nr:GntR family transcriptional regulator [Burkholderiales bacterium]